MKEKKSDDFGSVVAEFGNLISHFGFSCPEKLWYSNLVSLSKNVDDIYYCYVIARVYKNDSSLETTLWVGSINRPDDGLENLSANIKMQISYTQVLDHLFFRNCESKIIILIESGILKTLLTASQNELKYHSIHNYCS
ncbi:Imm25 family immunity protein [Sphingobacterium spiritivorum]|uniref:Imm25 family immunity protein n=1 Tax=Sphingobacterium spiritivorum TaxID=258 RepID=UPI003DA5A79B